MVWRDTFSCLLSAEGPYANRFNLKNYLKAQHVWVSKTGMGVGFGVNPEKSGGLGSIDQALQRLGQKRQISVFTRHYQMPAMLAANKDLIATLPTRVARMQANNDSIIMEEPPFFIPEFELTMAWSPLLQHHPAHRWLRQLIMHVARQVVAEEENPPPEIPVINHLF